MVLNIVIFLRAVEKCCCISGPDGDTELLPAIIPLIPSANFDDSLNPRIHESKADVIAVEPKMHR